MNFLCPHGFPPASPVSPKKQKHKMSVVGLSSEDRLWIRRKQFLMFPSTKIHTHFKKGVPFRVLHLYPASLKGTFYYSEF